ncbi:hypothetical protein [Mucilaginibacter flavidus]|uniref:hypothetical protein n=1 Tax=Mucilaginibacter flavidus TaxID=2949309 RepID=UPI0020925A00|nr:hypothetical protein [Mucilaginibacter flavidus]MCO5948266.1 hypothetical protein [Mucilaginibacter flavidus]
MNQDRIYILIQKYRDNTASEAEEEALLKWYRQKAYQDAEFPESEDAVGDFMLSRLNNKIKQVPIIALSTYPIFSCNYHHQRIV